MALNVTSNATRLFGHAQTHVINVPVTIVTGLVFALQIPSCSILFVCKRIPYQIRFVSISFLISELGFGLSVLINQLAVHIGGVGSWSTETTRVLIPGIFHVISMAHVAHIALDRYLAVSRPFHYNTFLTQTKVCVALSAHWLLPIIVIGSFTGYQYSTSVVDGIQEGNWFLNQTKALRIVIFICDIVFHAIIVIAYILVFRIVRCQLSRVEPENAHQTERFAFTRVLIRIVAVYVLLHVPYTVNVLVLDVVMGTMGAWRSFFSGFSFFCIEVCSVINVYMYTWKFKECKYHCIRLLCSHSERFRTKLVEMRIEVFDIVTASTSLPTRHVEESRHAVGKMPSSQ